jgi:hypothetical protein
MNTHSAESRCLFIDVTKSHEATFHSSSSSLIFAGRGCQMLAGAADSRGLGPLIARGAGASTRVTSRSEYDPRGIGSAGKGWTHMHHVGQAARGSRQDKEGPKTLGEGGGGIVAGPLANVAFSHATVDGCASVAIAWCGMADADGGRGSGLSADSISSAGIAYRTASIGRLDLISFDRGDSALV